MMNGQVGNVVLEVHELSKHFGGLRALNGVSLELRAGEVLGLLGDNGAGKSTLIKCLSGVYQPDSGVIVVDGTEVSFSSPLDAQAVGIETVHQGLALVQSLDVASNLFLNREHTRKGLGWIGWLDRRRMMRESEEILGRLAIRLPDPRTVVVDLSGGQRQAIAIGRAVAWGQHIVLMDEPAAALGVEQSRHVLELIETLSSQGVAIVLITHNMQHVVEACDRAVVLRHGRKVADVPVAGVDEQQLVHHIVGGSR